MRLVAIFMVLLLLVGCNSRSPSTLQQNSPGESFADTIPPDAHHETNDSAIVSLSEAVSPDAIGFTESEVMDNIRLVAGQCRGMLNQSRKIETLDSIVFDLSLEKKYDLLSYMGQLGCSTEDRRMDMCNPDAVRVFYQAYEADGNAEVSIYSFNGQIVCTTFICREGTVYGMTSHVNWDSDMQPLVHLGEIHELGVFTLTEKGYLFYGSSEESTLHIRTVSGIRVEPLGDENRGICREYIDPLVSYVSTGVFCLDWDETSLDRVGLNDVFEYLYKMEYGVSPDTVYTAQFIPGSKYPMAVPATEFEDIITRYFPVSAEQLRQIAVYNPERQCYAYEIMMFPDASPDWEVVDYTQNEDGSLAITMDAVSPENRMDRTATNKVVIMPRDDGSFQYLSNRVMRFDEGVNSRIPTFTIYSPRVC